MRLCRLARWEKRFLPLACVVNGERVRAAGRDDATPRGHTRALTFAPAQRWRYLALRPCMCLRRWREESLNRTARSPQQIELTSAREMLSENNKRRRAPLHETLDLRWAFELRLFRFYLITARIADFLLALNNVSMSITHSDYLTCVHFQGTDY